MRKSEVIVVEQAGGPVSLTFQRLTIEQEEQYIVWVQDAILRDGRRMLQSFASHVQMQTYSQLVKDLGAGTCSLTGAVGAERCAQGAGMRKFLQLAAAEKHPELDDAAAFELVAEHYDDCLRVVKSLAPAAAAMAAAERRAEAGGPK